MKKSILLIAPLAFLWSCSQSSEIFDDAYNGSERKPVVVADEEEGYADYIKKEEGNYNVVVDSGSTIRSGLNPSYYNSTQQGNNQNNYNGNSGYYNDPVGFGESCPHHCDVYYDGWRCDHIIAIYGFDSQPRPYGYNYSPGYYWGYSGFYPMGYHYGYSWGNSGYFTYTTSSGYWNTWNGNPAWSNQWGCANYYYGNSIYYGYNSWGYGNNCGWGSYYDPYWGYNYGWNGYGGYPYWGYNSWNYPYYNPYYNNWNNNNNNNSNWGETTSSSSNHYYGHRGGTNTGSYSQNNTNYEHTVKAKEDIVVASPFPLYSSLDQNQVAVNVFESKPVKPIGGSNTFNGSTQPIDNSSNISQVAKPDYVNTNSTNEKPGSFTSSQPVYSTNTSTSTVNKTNTYSSVNKTNSVSNNTSVNKTVDQKVIKVGKPAQNQFSGANNSTTANSGTVKTNTYSSNSSSRTYDNPNKYGTQTKYDNTYTPAPNVYNNGANSSNSRRTNNSGTTNNVNSGNNRGSSSSNTNYGSRSSSSGSSGSSSNSSSGGSSRRK